MQADEEDDWAAFESAESTPFSSPPEAGGGDRSGAAVAAEPLGAFSTASPDFFSATTFSPGAAAADGVEVGAGEEDVSSALPGSAFGEADAVEDWSAAPRAVDEAGEEGLSAPAAADSEQEYGATDETNINAENNMPFEFADDSIDQSEPDHQGDASLETAVLEEQEEPDIPQPTIFLAPAFSTEEAAVTDSQEMDLPQSNTGVEDGNARDPARKEDFLEHEDIGPSSTNIDGKAEATGASMEAGSTIHDSFSDSANECIDGQDGDSDRNDDIYVDSGTNNRNGSNEDKYDDDDDDEFGDFDYAEPMSVTEATAAAVAIDDGNGDDMDEFGEMEGNNHTVPPKQEELQADLSHLSPTQHHKNVWEMSKEEYMMHIGDVLSSSFSNHTTLDSDDSIIASSPIDGGGENDRILAQSDGAENVLSRIMDDFVTPILREHPRLYEDLFDEPEPSDMKMDDENFRAVNQTGNLSSDNFAQFGSVEERSGAEDSSNFPSFVEQERNSDVAKTSPPSAFSVQHSVSSESAQSGPTGHNNFREAQFEARSSIESLEQRKDEPDGTSSSSRDEYGFGEALTQFQQNPQLVQQGSSQSDMPGLMESGWDMFANMNVVHNSQSPPPHALGTMTQGDTQEEEKEGPVDRNSGGVGEWGDAFAGAQSATTSSSASFSVGSDMFVNMDIAPALSFPTTERVDENSCTRDNGEEKPIRPSELSGMPLALEVSDHEASERAGKSQELSAVKNSGACADTGHAENCAAVSAMQFQSSTESRQHQQGHSYPLEEDDMFANMEITGMQPPDGSLMTARLGDNGIEAVTSTPLASAAGETTEGSYDWSGWDSAHQDTHSSTSGASANPVKPFGHEEHSALSDAIADKNDKLEPISQTYVSTIGKDTSAATAGVDLFANMDIVPTLGPPSLEEEAPFQFDGFSGTHSSGSSVQPQSQSESDRSREPSGPVRSSPDVSFPREKQDITLLDSSRSMPGLQQGAEQELYSAATGDSTVSVGGVLAAQGWGSFGQAEGPNFASPSESSSHDATVASTSAFGYNTSVDNDWGFPLASTTPESDSLSNGATESCAFPPNSAMQVVEQFGDFSHGGNDSSGVDKDGNNIEEEDDFGAFASPDIGGAAVEAVASATAANGAPLEPTPFTWHSVPIPTHLSFMLSDSIYKAADSGGLL